MPPVDTTIRTSAVDDQTVVSDCRWGEPLGPFKIYSSEHRPALTDHDIHLWTVAVEPSRELALDDPAANGAAADQKADLPSLDLPWLGDLNEEERVRALRFVRRRDGYRFALVRRALRRLLGLYTSVQPSAIQFALGPQGKPQLAEALGKSDIQFNVSHSATCALIGLRRQLPVGVDIEQQRLEVDFDGVARLMFSASETAWLSSVAPEERGASFYRLWSRKEAILKCVGWGLGGPRPTTSWSVHPRATERWPLPELESVPGYDPAQARLLLVDLEPPTPAGLGRAPEVSAARWPLQGYSASVAAWSEPAASSIRLRLGHYHDFA